MMQEDIAIVGMSIFCPAGESTSSFWRGISQGEDFITEAPDDVIENYYFEEEPNGVDRFYCRRGGFTRPFSVDPLRYGILPVTADGVDPDQLVSVAGTEQALMDAGVFEKNISLRRGSVIIGRGNFAGIIALRCLEIIRTSHEVTELLKIALPDLTREDLDRVRKAYQQKKGRYQADMAIGTMPNLVASLVANRFDMHGPAYLVDAACASGIVAIDHSIALLRRGDVDIAVAGGLHTGQSAMFWGAFDMIGAMSRRQEIAPFSKHADGLLVGQGGGFIVLKTLKKALEDGDRIYALIKETAVGSDGGGSHVTVTNVEGQVDVLARAWQKAKMDPRQVGYIEAHGTATPVGDRTELATLRKFFGDHTCPRAFVGSVKSNIGHTMPAAGMIGVIKTALSLYHRKIAPTLHCEEPLEDMFESRFRPPQACIDWDPEQYPLVAGVNAFGFGGINSHAILTAHEPDPEIPVHTGLVPRLAREALAVSAEDPETLMEKLQSGTYTNSGGNCRIAILDPDGRRIRMAIDIIRKNKPWHGKLGIWYTDRPLLTEGGKIVFLFPGFAAETEFELDSLSESLDLPYFDDLAADWDLEKENALSTLQIYYVKKFSALAMEKLGVTADLYAGHSIGEWDAAWYAGLLREESGNELDQNFWDQFELEETEKYPFIAVAANADTAKRWCQEIPGLYLANDNCHDQMVFCGDKKASATFLNMLEETGVFHTVLPFGWGAHTPLADLTPYREFIEKFQIGEGRVPVWSGVTLAPAPVEREAYLSLVELQMSTTVRFRELIEKLYREENARVFIQIGPGNLTGFVENILKDKDFSVIATTKAHQNGADQIRSVLAMLFAMGHPADLDYLGVNPAHRTDHTLKVLPRGAPPILHSFPELKEVIKSRYGAAGPGGSLSCDVGKTVHPFLHLASRNVKEALRTQSELISHFEDAPFQPLQRVGEAETPRQPVDFEEELVLNLADHLYLLDHAIIRQPENWYCAEDLNPVVPLAMTIELLAEAAKRRAPGRKILRIRRIGAFKWIGLETPFTETLKGTWKSPDVLQLQLGNYASAEIVFGEEWPAYPEEFLKTPDMGEEIMPPTDASILYDRYSFHGPQYHGGTGKTRIHAKGLISRTKQKEGKGSLLDTMGQQLGLFLHLTQTENTISFPVQVKEITFYEDIFDQDGVFDHELLITKLTGSSVTGSMILRRSGKIWCVAKGYICQRFSNVIPVWNVILKPKYHILAEETAPGIFRYHDDLSNQMMGLLSKRYLNHWDREKLGGVTAMERADLTEVRALMIRSIVMKDAVRRWLSKDGAMLYPVEICCEEGETGDFTAWQIREGIREALPVHLRLDWSEGTAMVTVDGIKQFAV